MATDQQVNPYLTQDGTRSDFLEVTFTSQLDRTDRSISAQSFMNGPVELIRPRGRVFSRDGGTVLSKDGLQGTGSLATDSAYFQAISGQARVSGFTTVYLTTDDGFGGVNASIFINTSGDIEFNPLTQVTSFKKIRIQGTFSDPTASSTAHPFDIGPSSTSTGNLRLKLGPSAIKAVDGTLTSALKLNPAGGAILGRDYQMVPLRNVGTAISGSAPASTSTTAEYYMQGGTTNISFSAGVGTLTFPTAFGSGLLTLVVMGKSDAEFDIMRGSGTSNNTSAQLIAFLSGAAYTGSADVNWIAIGW